MKFYIEITLLSGPDVGINFLWSRLYQQIHLALVDNGNRAVSLGVSFPQYDADQNKLGSKLRIFAKSELDLAKMNVKQWLSRLLDYVHITQIREVPHNVELYAVYKRQQPVRSYAKLERLINRRAKRENISIEKARNDLITNSVNVGDEKLKTPFIDMKSMSSGNWFRLFIVKEKATNYFDGNFSSYGLSNNSTVPDF